LENSAIPVSLSPARDPHLLSVSSQRPRRINKAGPCRSIHQLFDPWTKRDAWRKHPVFSNRAMFANLFPGFGIAVVAFSAYVLVENVLGKGKHQAVEDKHH
ncbi:NADH-ubiquinone oxidoreductase B12 subunit family-domain-containing protein, partial [Lactarius hatsudake]